jgi:hypothetical protein
LVGSGGGNAATIEAMSGDAKMGAILMWQTATKLLGQRYAVVGF